MAYPDELLELARELANLHPGHPHQASLRRAVSTAYYALFHLLISEVRQIGSDRNYEPSWGAYSITVR